MLTNCSDVFRLHLLPDGRRRMELRLMTWPRFYRGGEVMEEEVLEASPWAKSI